MKELFLSGSNTSFNAMLAFLWSFNWLLQKIKKIEMVNGFVFTFEFSS